MTTFQIMESLKESFVKSYNVKESYKVDFWKEGDNLGNYYHYAFTCKMENGRIFMLGVNVVFPFYGKVERELFVDISENHKTLKHARIEIDSYDMNVYSIKQILADNFKINLQ